MQKVRKVLLAVSILIILSVQTVSAQEDIAGRDNMIGQGSIQIILSDEGTGIKKEGIEFQCVKVADIVEGEYIFYEEISCNIKSGTNEMMTAKEQEQMASALAEKTYDSDIKQTDSKGEILFDDLGVGLYLLKAKDSKAYGTISPSLVAVPTWNEIEKEMEYDVKVIPKYTKEISQSVKTGDSENVAGYAAVAWIALLCMLCIGVIRRRKFYGRK